MIDFTAGAPVAGSLDVAWNHGRPRSATRTEPPIQVHAYDEHTVHPAAEQDASATRRRSCTCCSATSGRCCSTPARPRTRRCSRCGTPSTTLIDDWLAAHPRDGVRARRRAHPRPRRPRRRRRPVRRAGRTPRSSAGDLEAVPAFFGFTSWPDRDRPASTSAAGCWSVTGIPGPPRALDRGLRPVDRLPRHRRHRLPGRLYASTCPAFVDSLERLVEFTDTARSPT